nr:hypothetical protein [Candidatus Sigynarchaeota archaeon]
MNSIENERAMLKLQRDVIERQTHEVQKEMDEMRKKYAQVIDPESPAEVYSTEDFLVVGRDGSSSKLLSDAMKYYETHDGCPWYEDAEHQHCKSVWARMGSICPVLVGHVKELARNLKK